MSLRDVSRIAHAGPAGLLPAAVLLAALALGYFQVADPDAYWHLKAGQVMLESGRLLRTNLFSAAYPDRPWQNMEWLFEVFLAGAYEAGGWAGVAFLKLAVVAATAALLYRTLIGAADAPLFAAGNAILLLCLLRYRFSERPHLLSTLFFLVTVWAVERARRRGGRALWAIPPLFALWSNVHPEVIFGLAYLAATAAGAAAEAGGGGASFPGTPRRLGALLPLAAAATLLNPSTTGVLLLPLRVTQDAATPRILEYGWSTPAAQPLFWVIAAAAAALLVAHRGSRRWPVLLPLALFFALGLRYNRATAYFGVVAGVMAQGALAALASSSPARRRRLGVALALLAAAALSWTALLDRRLTFRWGHGPDDRIVPEGAANFILANRPPPALYNDYNDGGYLLFRLHPEYGVFQDGRTGLYPAEHFAALADRTGRGLLELVRKQSVNTALVHKEKYGSLFPPALWGLVYWDDLSLVLVRRAPGNEELLRRLEYGTCIPGRALPSDRAGLLAAVRELGRNQAERVRPSWRVAVALGIVHGRLGDLPAARAALERAAALAPAEPEPWQRLGEILASHGRREEAEAAWSRARARGAGGGTPLRSP